MVIQLVVDSPDATVNGKATTLDVPPAIIGGRTMVAVHFVSEALGLKVDWDGDTQTVTVSAGSTTLSMRLNDPQASVNGQPVTLDVLPTLVNGRTLVPLHFVAEALGLKVDWDGALAGMRRRPDLPD